MAFQAALDERIDPGAPPPLSRGGARAGARIALLGRYILSDGREFPCQTRDLSADGAAVYAPVRGSAGEEVTLCIGGLGRLSGRVADAFPGGFRIELDLEARRREEMEKRLERLLHRAEGACQDLRLLAGEPPQSAPLRLATGEEIAVEVMSLSLSGATVRVGAALAIGMRLVIGKTPGRVIRNIEDCVMIEFLAPVRKLWPSGQIDF